MGDQLIIARSHVRRVGCLSYHRNVVFGQENLNQLRHEFRGHSRKAKLSVKMECTEPVLIPPSSASSRTVTRWSCMTKVRTWSMAMSTLVRFHLPLALSPFHAAFVKGMPFGAYNRRMPQPVLTCASVDVQLVTSVDGNSMEVSDAALLAGISAAFIVLKNVRKKREKYRR